MCFSKRPEEMSVRDLFDLKAMMSSIAEYLKEAANINASGSAPRKTQKELQVPEALKLAFLKSKKFQKAFDDLKSGDRNQWIKHIASAKLEATRLARIERLRMELISK
jgi:uncharacterized protein YdeI (YjbR/CyaY-like superfamily)